MAYDSNTQVISAPVDMGDIADALGVDSLDLGTLCTSEKVNKFSKHKPIRFNKWGILSDAEFKGMSTDAAENIYYGIKIKGPTSAELGPSLVEIHDTTFEYIRPEGGSDSPFRMLDFDGYKHNAVANPGASFQISSREDGILKAYYNDEDHQYGSLYGISVQYLDTNEYGVDFIQMFSDGSESLENTLKRAYPCILVTDSSGKSYFTALDYPSDNGVPEARPLYYNGVFQQNTNWSVRMGKPRLQTATSQATSKPWNSAQTGMKATLFLVKSADIYGPYLDIAKTQNFSENWVPLVDRFLIAGKPIVLPADVLGATLELSKYGAARVYFEPTGIRASITFLTIGIAKVGTTEESVSLECRLTIDGVTCTQTYTISPNAVAVPSFFATELNLLLVAGMELSASVTLITTDSQGKTTTTGDYTFIVE